MPSENRALSSRWKVTDERSAGTSMLLASRPYSVNGSAMTLYGPAVWRQPNPQSPNLFCEPETPSDYTWSLSGSTLTIRNKQQACADRDIVFVGRWVKSS